MANTTNISASTLEKFKALLQEVVTELNRPFCKMAPTEGGLESGGIDCFAVCVPSP